MKMAYAVHETFAVSLASCQFASSQMVFLSRFACPRSPSKFMAGHSTACNNGC